MRFKIVGDHRNFFSKERHIEFEDVFSTDQIEKLSEHVDQVLAKRAHKLIETASPQDLYRVGRDLWRDDPVIREFVCNRRLAEVAAQLFDQKLLQLAFDQSLRTPVQSGYPSLTPSPLQQISCIQPLAGALILRLSGSAENLTLFPKKKENIVFIGPDLTIPWEVFFQEPAHSFLLIAYAPARALYILEKRDPHVHDLKKLGYGFGDNIKDPAHPIVFNGR
jgi:hypothetical protein